MCTGLRNCRSRFNVQDGIEVGVGTILPGLRTFFEMAVGPSRRESAGESMPFLGTDYPTCGHLTKTLGLHEDTPALAPFLGKNLFAGVSEYMSKMNRSTYVHPFRILLYAQSVLGYGS